MSRPTAVVVEADGGSRGNPGKAAYGAVLKDADTGRVLAERAERIGVASNNVAEYRGLIAGLELYRQHADGAELEVRMDSKLVVEQMAGRWKIKHPSMRPLALEANRLVPPGTRWTWIPRERNKHADRLANVALDGPEGVVHGGPVLDGPEAPAPSPQAAGPADPAAPSVTTTLVLVAHGDLDAVAPTAAWVAAGLVREPAALIASSDPGAVASAEVLGQALGTTPVVDGALDGLLAGAGSVGRLRARLTHAHRGRVVVVVCSPQQVVALAAHALGLPSGTTLRAAPAAGSVTVLGWRPEAAVLQVLGAGPRLVLGPLADVETE